MGHEPVRDETDIDLDGGRQDFVVRAFCYLEGDLAADAVKQLEAELQADPQKRQLLVELCLTRAGVIETMRNRAEVQRLQFGRQFSADIARRQRRIHWPAASRRWLVAASVLLACATGVIVWTLHRDSARTTVAVSVGARWDGAESGLSQGKVLPKGEHVLAAGLVQITLGSGAVVAVEGPTRFEVISPTRIRLSQGRLTATVPHGSAGLSIQTPDLLAVDLGTAFGVEVDPGVQSRLEVFQGSVRAEIAAAGKPATSQVVTANQAVLVASGSDAFESVPTTPAVFVRPEDVAAQATSQFQRWQNFSEKLRHDPTLLVYYTFDQPAQDRTILRNTAATTESKYDGQLGITGSGSPAPMWDTGRWPEKSSLRFGDAGTTAVRIPNPVGLIADRPMTVVCWVQRVDLKRPAHLLQMSVNQAQQFDLCLTGTDGSAQPAMKPLSIYLSHTNTVHSKEILPADDHWHFVAVTVGQNRKVCFYVDGAQVGVASFAMKPIFGLGDLFIGAPSPDSGPERNDGLHGKIDELAIFSRVLPPSEIKKCYDSGRCD
jgi:hypothetical protein